MVVKRTLQAIAGLFALLVVALLVSRWWPASAEQVQARTALEARGDWPGRNAWPLLATLDHAGLEAGERDAMVATHADAFAAWAQATALQRHGSEAVYPEPPALPAPPATPEQSPAYCRAGIPDCLAHVRAHPEAVAADVDARKELIAAIAGLADYQHARSPYPPDVHAPLPSALGRLFTPLAGHALAHVQGNSAQALDGLCRDMGSARMLASQSDSLIVAMVGARWLQANGELLGNVLAELPADVLIPAGCKAGLQILEPAAISLCRPLQGEYAMGAAGIGHSHAAAMAHQPGASWLFDLDKTLNRQAANLGAACQTPLQERIAQDLPIDTGLAPAQSRSLWHIDCATNYIGCVLSAIAAPAYDKHIVRMQDVAASQRLLAVWLWLREQPRGSDAALQLTQLPAELQSVHRPVQLSADGRALEVARYYNSDSQGPLRLVLPPVLQTPVMP